MKDDFLLNLSVRSLRSKMPKGLKQITLIGPSFIEPMARRLDENFMHEDDILNDFTLSDIKRYFRKRGCSSDKRAGWYLKQFINIGYSLREDASKYYMAWDSDTILLRPIQIFDGVKPVFSIDSEFHRPYFNTIKSILNIDKQVPFSYITEYMIFNKDIARKMLALICKIKNVELNKVFEAILDSVDSSHLEGSGFAEYETYGNYVEAYHKGSYSYRKHNKLRNGSSFFGFKPTNDVLEWLSCDYDAVSFESHTPPIVINTNRWIRFSKKGMVGPKCLLQILTRVDAVCRMIKKIIRN